MDINAVAESIKAVTDTTERPEDAPERLFLRTEQDPTFKGVPRHSEPVEYVRADLFAKLERAVGELEIERDVAKAHGNFQTKRGLEWRERAEQLKRQNAALQQKAEEAIVPISEYEQLRAIEMSARRLYKAEKPLSDRLNYAALGQTLRAMKRQRDARESADG